MVVDTPSALSIISCRNYYLLIIFFGLATTYSFLDLRRQQRSQKGQYAVGNSTVNGLGYAVVTLFHINLTVIFIVNWLAPMLAIINFSWDMLRLVLIVADCAHSGYADLDAAMADVEKKPRSRAVGFLCASAVQLHKLQPGQALLLQ